MSQAFFLSLLLGSLLAAHCPITHTHTHTMSTASSATAAPEHVQRQSSSSSSAGDHSAEQQDRRLHPSQRVRFDWLEVVGCKRQMPSEEIMDLRREHVMHMRRVMKQQKAAEEAEAAGADPTAAAAAGAAAAVAEAADDDDDDDAGLSPEEDRFVHDPVLLPLPLEQLRIKPHIIERQLEPLLRARTAAELADAQAEAVQVTTHRRTRDAETVHAWQYVQHRQLGPMGAALTVSSCCCRPLHRISNRCERLTTGAV